MGVIVHKHDNIRFSSPGSFVCPVSVRKVLQGGCRNGKILITRTERPDMRRFSSLAHAASGKSPFNVFNETGFIWKSSIPLTSASRLEASELNAVKAMILAGCKPFSTSNSRIALEDSKPFILGMEMSMRTVVKACLLDQDLYLVKASWPSMAVSALKLSFLTKVERSLRFMALSSTRRTRGLK